MPEMWLHESRGCPPLQLVPTLRVQNGPPLPLDWKLRRLLHLEAIPAIFVLCDQSMLLHSRMDVYGCKEKTHDAHLTYRIHAKFAAKAYANDEILQRGGKKNYNRRQ